MSLLPQSVCPVCGDTHTCSPMGDGSIAAPVLEPGYQRGVLDAQRGFPPREGGKAYLNGYADSWTETLGFPQLPVTPATDAVREAAVNKIAARTIANLGERILELERENKRLHDEMFGMVREGAINQDPAPVAPLGGREVSDEECERIRLTPAVAEAVYNVAFNNNTRGANAAVWELVRAIARALSGETPGQQ